MPRFITSRDVGMFNGINHELIDKVIETKIVFYALYNDEQDTNLYNESTDKMYEPGIICNALIDNQPPTIEDTEIGPNVYQVITCAILRKTLKELDFYPEIGDIVQWNGAYYEISGAVIDNQLLGGRVQIPYSVVFSAAMINKSMINTRHEM